MAQRRGEEGGEAMGLRAGLPRDQQWLKIGTSLDKTSPVIQPHQCIMGIIPTQPPHPTPARRSGLFLPVPPNPPLLRPFGGP